MEMIRIAGTTREMAKNQKEYATLCIRDDFIRDDKMAFHAMASAWQPTPEEIALIVAGAPIYLSIFNGPYPPGTPDFIMLNQSRFPPVRLHVGEAPPMTGG